MPIGGADGKKGALNMEVKAFAGIDVGKADHMCCIVDAVGNVLAGSFPFANDAEGFSKLLAEPGRKEVLGFWMGPEESPAAWGKCLQSLRERGVGNPLLFVTDGLQGMPEAIRRAFPDSLHQRCLVHVGRNMSSGARKKDRQGILDDFKEVYSAESEAEAKARLALFVAKWAKAYPSFRKYLSEPGLFSFYGFPRPIRKALYTSNAVEAFHACLKRKLKSRLGIHSIRNGHYLISVEAERYNRSKHCKAIAGFDEMTAEELASLGMRR